MKPKYKMTADQIALRSHIRKLNIQAKASGNAAMIITEDLQYWSYMGVNSVDEFEFENIRTEYSNTFKDLHGYRPATNRFKTAADIMVELELLVLQLFRARRVNTSYNKAVDTLFLAV